MRTQSLRLAIAFTAALVPGAALAQHEAHQTGAGQASPEMLPCARVRPVVDNIIAAAMARLESARQSNNAAEMRAAVDHLEGALRDIRTQVTSCCADTAVTDSHAGHATPGSSQPPSTPAPATQSPASAVDPHAGHAMRPAPAAPRSVQTPRPAPGKAERAHSADPHAGHSPQQSEKQMDPVNGLMVDPATAPKTTYQGQTYYFSSEQTRKEFLENPGQFARRPKR
jgi:YHS domain-containing protein